MRDATSHSHAAILAPVFALLASLPAAAHAQQAANAATQGSASSNPTHTIANVDAPISVAWPARRAWTDGAESEYGPVVATIGHAVAAGRGHTLAG